MPNQHAQNSTIVHSRHLASLPRPHNSHRTHQNPAADTNNYNDKHHSTGHYQPDNHYPANHDDQPTNNHNDYGCATYHNYICSCYIPNTVIHLR